MRTLLLSLAALGSLAAVAASNPVAARPLAPAWSDVGLQRAQYYEPGWREREEWRRRREFEERRREEWRRAHEWRGYPPPPPPGFYPPPPPPPFYGPRY